MARNQVADAQMLYDGRSQHYDDSWHPRFARHMVELAKLHPGERVLDLACGTGLVSLSAASLVGPSGEVVGVDISAGMLAQAYRKKRHHSNLRFYQHSITDLGTLAPIQNEKFDVIICASALVLLQNPGLAIKQWVELLRPGGRLVTDVTHPASQIDLITFERVGKALGRPVPWYRTTFLKPEDLTGLMSQAGLKDITTELLSQMDIPGTERLESYMHDPRSPRVEKVYHMRDADSLFQKAAESKVLSDLANSEQAEATFDEEWRKLADSNGEIHEIDGVFVGIGYA